MKEYNRHYEYDTDEKDKILNALNLLKEVCNRESHCEDCIFGTDSGDCKIQNQPPCGYDIADCTEKWRALK